MWKDWGWTHTQAVTQSKLRASKSASTDCPTRLFHEGFLQGLLNGKLWSSPYYPPLSFTEVALFFLHAHAMLQCMVHRCTSWHSIHSLHFLNFPSSASKILHHPHSLLLLRKAWFSFARSISIMWANHSVHGCLFWISFFSLPFPSVRISLILLTTKEAVSSVRSGTGSG